jgi:hypothetical protein
MYRPPRDIADRAAAVQCAGASAAAGGGLRGVKLEGRILEHGSDDGRRSRPIR